MTKGFQNGSVMNAMKLAQDLKEVEKRDEEFAKIMQRVKVIDSLVENFEENTDEMA